MALTDADRLQMTALALMRHNVLSVGVAAPAKGFIPTAWDEDGYITHATIYNMSWVVRSMFYSSFFALESLVLIGVTELSTNALTDMSDLESVVLPDTLTGIGTGVFNGLEYLVLTALPDGLEYIGTLAFCGCTSLSKIWIPASCTTIYATAYSNSPFYQCSSGLTLYCEAASKPAGWGTYWNYYGNGLQLTVVWDTTLAEFEAL